MFYGSLHLNYRCYICLGESINNLFKILQQGAQQLNICVITDSCFLYEKMKIIIQEKRYAEDKFDFFFSQWNQELKNRYQDFKPISLRDKDTSFFDKYNLFFSLHCKQIFPDQLVDNYICINIHPGYNPYNRGYFPQVFSILNGLPVGVTIHRMDREIDHGPILYQEKVTIEESDTSYDIYQKIQEREVEMLQKYLPDIIDGNYEEKPMEQEGNINYMQDFENLCKLDLNKSATYGEVILHLRAMSFPKYKNAWFVDSEGNKIYVSIALEKDSPNS